MKQTAIIHVQGIEIRIIIENDDEYICLTDLARKFGGNDLIKNWLRTRSTLEFLGTWEKINNKNFNWVEFDLIKNESGSNKFLLSVKKWQCRTNAIGIMAKVGKYHSGTYAHRNIALEFCSWLSPEFKLYLIQEFERLKVDDAKQRNNDWDISRFLASINYKIQNDSIRENIIPKLNISKEKEDFIYSNEADLLNLALFGKTAKKWREDNSKLAINGGNIRDYATISQLIVLSNLESSNAKMITKKIDKLKRLEELNNQAIREMKSLSQIDSFNSSKLIKG